MSTRRSVVGGVIRFAGTAVVIITLFISLSPPLVLEAVGVLALGLLPLLGTTTELVLPVVPNVAEGVVAGALDVAFPPDPVGKRGVELFLLLAVLELPKSNCTVHNARPNDTGLLALKSGLVVPSVQSLWASSPRSVGKLNCGCSCWLTTSKARLTPAIEICTLGICYPIAPLALHYVPKHYSSD